MLKTYIVTGASQNHFKSLKQFLTTVNNITQDCFVWDLGLDQQSVIELKTLFNNFSYRKFDYSKYPDYYNINVNAGEYAWKPAVIKETMDELLQQEISNSKILFWCDAGNMLNSDSIKLLEDIVIVNKLYSPTSNLTIKILTHPKTLDYFSINTENPILNNENRNAAQIGFLISDKEIQEFVNQFFECARQKACIAPEGSNRSNHRQDQAVFTILYYKFYQTHPQYTINDTHVCKIHCDID
jgi:hypothetical protein